MCAALFESNKTKYVRFVGFSTLQEQWQCRTTTQQEEEEEKKSFDLNEVDVYTFDMHVFCFVRALI